MTVQFHLFMPQMRLTFDALTERAQAAEAAGFNGMATIDHLQPPGAVGHPMYEAMTTATWLAARTERLVQGHLVLCDSFRHPAMTAMTAVSIDHASNGRFELGIGWGSVPAEFTTFGIGETAPPYRVSRLAESLAVITALWRGESVTVAGEHFTLTDAVQAPTPLTKIPILIGGSGTKTLKLVAQYADWWNLPVHQLDKFDEKREQAGNARVSIQQMATLIRPDQDRAEVTATALRRFGHSNPTVGSAEELVDHFGKLADRGIERFYVWFTDFAPAETIAAFGEGVIAPLQ
ncbi:MAG: LLM class flavin-dependent oxidoreductase [Acidimicrobiia bacterium]